VWLAQGVVLGLCASSSEVLLVLVCVFLAFFACVAGMMTATTTTTTVTVVSLSLLWVALTSYPYSCIGLT
jgi:hypothetical protein